MASITPDYEYIAPEKAGVIAMTVVSTISFLCVSTTLLHILSVAVRPWFQKTQPKTDRSFLQRQTGVFIACLLFADFLQAVGGILQSRWAFEGGITDGALCNFQAIILMLGDNGAAVFSAVIATHTFIAIVLGKRFPRWVVILIVVLGWALTAFMALIGPLLLYSPNVGPFYGIAHSWCFATGAYAVDRVLLHCLPEFTSATIILLSYLLVWLSLRGHLVLSGESGWQFYRKPVARLNDLNAIANKMLWYPTVYIILVVPISVCRFITLDGSSIDSVAWTVSMCLLFSMGAADTVIYAMTRNVGPTIPAKMIPSWISSRIGSTSGKHSRGISSSSAVKSWRSAGVSEGGDTDFYDIHPAYSPHHKPSPSNMSPVTYSFQPLISPASATFSPASSVFPQHARNASINSNVMGGNGSRNGSRVQVNVVTEKEVLTDPPPVVHHPFAQFHR